MVQPIAPRLQTCTIVTQWSVILYYYNLMGPPSYIQSVTDQNFIMQSMTVVQGTFLVVPIKSWFLCGKIPPCKPTLLDSGPGTPYAQIFFMSVPMAS